MKDIVERLRLGNPLLALAAGGEAADLIETLRARVAELEGYKDAWLHVARCRDTAEKELAALKATGSALERRSRPP